MKIHFLSDLHIEFGKMRKDYQPPAEADVVVLAGDIGVGLQGIDWAIKTFEVPAVYVPGNHEYYGQRPMQSFLREAREKAGASEHLYFLENESVWIDGVCFAGATLWTDFAAVPGLPAEYAMNQAQQRMTDYQAITIETRQATQVYRSRKRQPRFTPRMALARHQESRDFLEREFRELLPGEKLVVVTHHAPSPQSLLYREAIAPVDAAYVSNLESLVANSGADLWIHGHLHSANDYVIGNTRVVSNCRGYADVGVDAAPGFKLDAIVEI
jgi:predicted phosphodiesterase